MFKHKRRGIALITVVLISALLFVSIIGITLKVIPENKIIAARSASERALSASETGLSQILFNLRNANFDDETTAPSGGFGFEYISINQVRAIAEATSGSNPFTYNEAPPVPGGGGTPYVVYQVKIKKIAGDPFDPDLNMSELPNTLEIYSMGIVYEKQNGKVLARKAIQTKYDIIFELKPTTEEGENYNLKYGIVSGGNIQFIGSSNRVFHGDIYAGGLIDKSSNNIDPIVLDGKAFAVGTIDSGIVPTDDKRIEGAPPIGDEIDKVITMLNDYNESMADDFKNGTGLYDGTNLDYPNTNPNTFPGLTGIDKQTIQNIMNDYLGNDTDLVKKVSFYNDLVSGKIITDNPVLSANGKSFFINMLNTEYLSKIVVYYKGDFDFQSYKDLEVNGELKLGGVLIVDGDLNINSSVTINPDINPLLIRVTGNVDLAGGATLNGNIYASGEDANKKVGVGNFTLNGFLVTPRAIGVNGQFTCSGSLIAKGSIDLKGTTNITYVDRGLGDMVVPGEPTTVTELRNVISAEILVSSWKEISFDAFQNP